MSAGKRKEGKPYKACRIGPLPVEIINDLLGTELEQGDAWLSVMAHSHMAEDHPGDYPVCFSNLADAIANPTYIGQDPQHGRNFIIVKRVQGGGAKPMLVAICLEPNEFGNYNICSAYLIDQQDVDRRREKGYLKSPLSKSPR
jgi:hypothetical protein